MSCHPNWPRLIGSCTGDDTDKRVVSKEYKSDIPFIDEYKLSESDAESKCDDINGCVKQGVSDITPYKFDYWVVKDDPRQALQVLPFSGGCGRSNGLKYAKCCERSR